MTLEEKFRTIVKDIDVSILYTDTYIEKGDYIIAIQKLNNCLYSVGVGSLKKRELLNDMCRVFDSRENAMKYVERLK